MTFSVTEGIALLAVIVWPVIPILWIPVHCLPRFFKRIGFFTYLVPTFLWWPLAYVIYQHRDFVLQHTVSFPLAVIVMGWILFLAGWALQLWTLLLLTLPGMTGMPQVSSKVKGRIVATGPFSIVRHPTYLSHTLLFLGAFLLTGVTAAGIIALLDVVVINTVVVPLEEKELLARFGEEYVQYRKKVPSAVFPVKRKKA